MAAMIIVADLKTMSHYYLYDATWNMLVMYITIK